MRAEQVIATHGNTDFDAFGAMLAARLLYPDAVVAVGTLNRNVRDFYRLHADELGAIAEIGRIELDAIRRLVVVEVARGAAALDDGLDRRRRHEERERAGRPLDREARDRAGVPRSRRELTGSVGCAWTLRGTPPGASGGEGEGSDAWRARTTTARCRTRR